MLQARIQTRTRVCVCVCPARTRVFREEANRKSASHGLVLPLEGPKMSRALSALAILLSCTMVCFLFCSYLDSMLV